VRSAHEDGDVEALLYFASAGESFPVIRREEGGDANQIRFFMSDLLPDLFKGSAEMVVMKKRREGTCVGILEVIAEVGKLAGQRNGFASVSLMIVPDKDLDVGEEFPGYGLEHAKPQGLKPDVRVVEFLNGRLNEQDFHEISFSYEEAMGSDCCRPLSKSLSNVVRLDDGTFSSIPGLPACSFQGVTDG
jgi:hypothetical protein